MEIGVELVWPATGSIADPPRQLRTLSHYGRRARYHRMWATAEAASVLVATARKSAAIVIEIAARLCSALLVPARGCPCRNRVTAVDDGRKVWLSCNQPTTIGLGLNGQVAPVWSSPRQRGHRGMDLALPVNASLYRRALGTDQFRSFRASISRRN